MTRFHVQFLFLTLAFLTGCNAGATYDEDAEPYLKALGIDQAAAKLLDDAPIALRDALALTNGHNENLAVEGENYAQALIDKQRRIAAFLPTLTLGPSYTRRAGDVAGGGGRDSFNLPADIEINLFNGYRDVAALHANAATIEQRRAIVLDLQSDFLVETAFAFYNALRLDSSVKALENTATLQEERLRDIRTRLDNGLAKPLDVSQADAQTADTRTQLIAALNAASNARTALKLITAHPMASRQLIDDYAPPEQIEGIDAWQQLAAASRHDILAADAALAAARRDVEVAFGQYYPSVTLNLEYVLSVNNTSTENQWNAILRASVPIFTAGRIEADVRTAWSRVRQAHLLGQLVRRQVVADIETKHHDYLSAGQQIVQLKRRVAAAELALKQAEANYDVQLATNLDRLVAQDELLSARLDLITQEYSRKFAYLALLRAAGRLQAEMKVGQGARQP
jgi:outer membrane protein